MSSMKNETEKFATCLLAVAAFVVMLVAIYVVHALYFRVNVVFYSALLDVSLATTAAALFLIFLPRFRPLGSTERFLLITVCLLGGYAFAISVPTVVDRSLSLYILEKIDQRGGGIQRDALERIFIDEYMSEYRLVDVRLTEQLQSGTVTLKQDCLLLTPKGKLIASLSHVFRTHLLAKQRLLMDRYSGELTQPFRDSPGATVYSCR